MDNKNPFTKVCRLCLNTDVKLMAIFTKKKRKSGGNPNYDKLIAKLLDMEAKTTQTNYKVALFLTKFLLFQINAKDGLPRKICYMCSSVLLSFVNFQQKCTENEKKLRQTLLQIKQMSEIQRAETIACEDDPYVDQEIECLSPGEFGEGDVVVIDPKMEYLSSNDSRESEAGIFEEAQVSEAESETMEYAVEVYHTDSPSPGQIHVTAVDGPTDLKPDPDQELTPPSPKSPTPPSPPQPPPIEIASEKESFTDPIICRPESPAILTEQPSLLKIDILSNCSNLIISSLSADYHKSGSEEISQSGVAEEVDDHIMQDIIVAVLGDPNCIDLDAVENGVDYTEEPKDLSISPVEVYICHFCDAAFAEVGACEIHESDHNQETPFICLLCDDFKTADRESYIDHIKLQHNQTKPYNCFHCAKK